MNRRSFISGILASCAAPAIVRAGSLMPIIVPRQDLLPWQKFTRVWINGRDVTFLEQLKFVASDGGFLVPRHLSTVIVNLMLDEEAFAR